MFVLHLDEATEQELCYYSSYIINHPIRIIEYIVMSLFCAKLQMQIKEHLDKIWIHLDICIIIKMYWQKVEGPISVYHYPLHINI